MPRAATFIDMEVPENFTKGIEQARNELSLPIDRILFKRSEAGVRDEIEIAAQAIRAVTAYVFTELARATDIVDIGVHIPRRDTVTPVDVLRPMWCPVDTSYAS